MKHGLKVAGVVLAVSAVLAGCGTTATTTPSSTTPSASGGAAGGGEAAATYDPSAAAPKPKDGKRLKIGVTFPILDQFLQKVVDGVKTRAQPPA